MAKAKERELTSFDKRKLVETYAKAHPSATAAELVAKINAGEGVKIAPQAVGRYLWLARNGFPNGAATNGKTGARPAAVEPPPPAPAKPVPPASGSVAIEGGASIPLAALRSVKAEAPSASERKNLREIVERVERIAEQAGGLDALKRCLDVLDELGGE